MVLMLYGARKHLLNKYKCQQVIRYKEDLAGLINKFIKYKQILDAVSVTSVPKLGNRPVESLY